MLQHLIGMEIQSISTDRSQTLVVISISVFVYFLICFILMNLLWYYIKVKGGVSIKADEVIYSIDIRTNADTTADEVPSEAIISPIMKRIRQKDEACQDKLARRYGYIF